MCTNDFYGTPGWRVVYLFDVLEIRWEDSKIEAVSFDDTEIKNLVARLKIGVKFLWEQSHDPRGELFISTVNIAGGPPEYLLECGPCTDQKTRHSRLSQCSPARDLLRHA